MTIRLFLQQNMFDVHPGTTNRDFPTFARYYDTLGLVAVFDQLTGEFYAIRFDDVNDLDLYRRGEFTPPNTKLAGFYTNMTRCWKIHILPTVNLHTVETVKNLTAAFVAFESMVDAELNGVKHGVTFGERVFIKNAGARDRVGTVVGMTATTITVKLESGATSVFLPDEIEPLNVTEFTIPGHWVK